MGQDRRTVAVLGQMNALGESSVTKHVAVGATEAKAGADWLLTGLPARLGTPWTGEVCGEVYMTVGDFETASANRVAAGAKAFINSRGAVAGSIRSAERTYETPMTVCLR